MNEHDLPGAAAELAALADAFPIPEPAFRYSGSRELVPSECDEHAAAYFAFLVARTPGDLLSHVRRINLHRHQRSGEQVFGALVDLFVALGPAGQSLRARLLGQARSVLKPTQHQLLQQSLSSGLTTTDALAEAPRYSVLLRGMLGGAPIVYVAKQDADDHAMDPLAEAHSFLDFGQIEEARDLLERAVLREPARGDLQQELLEIYVHARDLDTLLAMRQHLLELGHEVGADWIRAEHALACGMLAQPPSEPGF